MIYVIGMVWVKISMVINVRGGLVAETGEGLGLVPCTLASGTDKLWEEADSLDWVSTVELVLLHGCMIKCHPVCQ